MTAGQAANPRNFAHIDTTRLIDNRFKTVDNRPHARAARLHNAAEASIAGCAVDQRPQQNCFQRAPCEAERRQHGAEERRECMRLRYRLPFSMRMRTEQAAP